MLITGAGGGLGGVTADLFAERGWQVFAADIAAPPARPKCVPIAMDVTDSDSCAAAMAKVASHTDGLGAVVNFAGVLEVGRPLVEAVEQRMKLSLDVNVFGTFLVNKHAFPLVRAGKGRIINISSEAGRNKAMALSAPYSVTKHAVEAYSDALRRELMFLGIPVVVIQPSAFRTDMTSGINGFFDAVRNPDSPFDDLIGKVARMVSHEDHNARDPRLLAEVVWTAVTTPRPKLRYAPYHKPRNIVLNHVPDRVLDWLMKRTLR